MKPIKETSEGQIMWDEKNHPETSNEWINTRR